MAERADEVVEWPTDTAPSWADRGIWLRYWFSPPLSLQVQGNGGFQNFSDEVWIMMGGIWVRRGDC
jgi:hypothetical protein